MTEFLIAPPCRYIACDREIYSGGAYILYEEVTPMKKYIKSTDTIAQDLPMLEEISILMDADISQYVELIGEGILDDTQVMSDWQNFMTLVEGFIDRTEQLELLHDEPENNLSKFPDVEGSHYYYIGVRNAEGEFVGKIVVDLRLSTHDSTRQSREYRKQHETAVLKIIQKKYKNAKAMIPKDLIVNKKTFKDYDTAAIAALGMLESIVKNYGG